MPPPSVVAISTFDTLQGGKEGSIKADSGADELLEEAFRSYCAPDKVMMTLPQDLSSELDLAVEEIIYFLI